MPRLLTHFLVFHWAVVFTLLAGLTALGGDLAGITGVNVFLADTADSRLALLSLPGGRALVGCAFALCAVFFWWALVTALICASDEEQQGEAVLRLAFTSAACLVTLLLVVGTLAEVDGLFSVVATHLAALVASFVAIRTEQQNRETVQDPLKSRQNEELRLAARVKAVDASTVVGLAKFTARRDAGWAQWEADR